MMLLKLTALFGCLLAVSAKPYHGYEQPDYTLAPHQPEVSRIEKPCFSVSSKTIFLCICKYILYQNSSQAVGKRAQQTLEQNIFSSKQSVVVFNWISL